MESPSDRSVHQPENATGIRGRGAQVAALALFLAASALVAWLGAFATVNNVNGWYVDANKAPWSPPNWLFGPVWTILYTAMAVAAWLVWRRGSPESRPALVIYGIQLFLNLVWTPVFFSLYPLIGSAALWLAFAVILALILAVTVTVVRFGPISRLAGILLLPYITWIVFASSLNLWAALNN
ncbi:TspO/MBR family protein [Pseudarthrobacter sp. NBSH8]|uniref:TspO/MBR family protein n=1 Tax=Pseudarthrobacter sp. NBSH8 TaxID=2596911 RepID=UPI00162547AF|nr:TspO/MBR family protein [Pseudarthrobacter sp. NBSH8]QNE13632.1 tryptophan-rich sensory protein [Pseudarthrobacter sp. NBSH8]